jgi:hypothetical protein
MEKVKIDLTAYVTIKGGDIVIQHNINRNKMTIDTYQPILKNSDMEEYPICELINLYQTLECQQKIDYEKTQDQPPDIVDVRMDYLDFRRILYKHNLHISSVHLIESKQMNDDDFFEDLEHINHQINLLKDIISESTDLEQQNRLTKVLEDPMKMFGLTIDNYEKYLIRIEMLLELDQKKQTEQCMETIMNKQNEVEFIFDEDENEDEDEDEGDEGNERVEGVDIVDSEQYDDDSEYSSSDNNSDSID